jgi:hypothetical protein
MRALIALGTLLAALTGLAAASAQAPDADAACQGLACPGVLPADSSADDSNVPEVATSDELEGVDASGFYRIANEDVVVYAVAAGDWASAPTEIRQLPLGDHLLATEKASKWMVIYAGGAMMSGPWPAKASAAATRHRKRSGPRAHAAAASDCMSPWFCVFNNTGFSGTKCQWIDPLVWQGMGNCTLDAESMVNRRNAWSLIRRAPDDRKYCAIPNSQDSTLVNNGFSNNGYETYNSTSSTKLAGWNCTN